MLLGVSIALALVANATGQHAFLMYLPSLPSFIAGTVLWRYQYALGGLPGGAAGAAAADRRAAVLSPHQSGM